MKANDEMVLFILETRTGQLQSKKYFIFCWALAGQQSITTVAATTATDATVTTITTIRYN